VVAPTRPRRQHGTGTPRPRFPVRIRRAEGSEGPHRPGCGAPDSGRCRPAL